MVVGKYPVSMGAEYFDFDHVSPVSAAKTVIKNNQSVLLGVFVLIDISLQHMTGRSLKAMGLRLQPRKVFG